MRRKVKGKHEAWFGFKYGAKKVNRGKNISVEASPIFKRGAHRTEHVLPKQTKLSVQVSGLAFTTIHDPTG
jgi:hypothetical protein